MASTIRICSGKWPIVNVTVVCTKLFILILHYSEIELPHGKTKVTLDDVMNPIGECISSITATSWIILFIAMLFWQFRTIKVIYHAVQYYDIKKFYNTALKIDDVSVGFSLFIVPHRIDFFWFCFRLTVGFSIAVRNRQFDLAWSATKNTWRAARTANVHSQDTVDWIGHLSQNFTVSYRQISFKFWNKRSSAVLHYWKTVLRGNWPFISTPHELSVCLFCKLSSLSFIIILKILGRNYW